MSANSKILYLMENIVDIGIAKSLQEELEFDLFAIIDTNEFMRKTFQEQDFLQFKKTWYYRDYVTKINNKPDVTYLENFEKKYNIKLWMIAYSERLFWDYNKYHQFTKNEILSIFEIECKLFEEILDQVKPDFVITKIPDYNQSELFYQICKAKKIPILMFNHSRFGYRYLISNDPDKIDNFNLEKYLGKHNKSFNELQEYIKKYTKQTTSIKDNFGVSNIQKLKASFRYLLKVCNNKYREYYVNYGRTRSKILWYETVIIFKKFFRGRYLKKYSIKEIDNKEKFVFMPLHFQPERSTLLATPFYIDQLNIIESVARSLPMGYFLYVKEHPIQIIHAWRNTSFYKKIRKMPNVRLLDPNLENENILKKCSIVLTLSGTLGLDAAFYEKPSIVFADVIYSKLSSVFRVKSLEELPSIIDEALQTSVNLEELNAYTDLVLENSFIYDNVDLIIKMQKEFFYGGFIYDVEIQQEKLLKFLNENNKIFKSITKEYALKIRTILNNQ